MRRTPAIQTRRALQLQVVGGKIRESEREMEGEAKRTDLQSLLEAIKSSEVLESRISLISQLGESYQPGTFELVHVFEWLITYWVDSTCSDISNFMLNKTILHVATKYLESDTSNCLSQFLILGTKANIWCGKHLQMTTMPIEELRDGKHSELFSQLILDTLSFSSTTISALTRSPILGEKVVMLIIENFILELLNLTKALIMEIKKFDSIASEVLKMAQIVLDAVIKLCRAYFQTISSDSYEMNINRKEGIIDDKEVDYASHIIRLTACTIENLYQLGIFAAAGGGSLVTVLNASWKGVVCLLQLGKGVLTEKVNVGDIILTLVSLATESLRCAAEAWSSTLIETLAISEAKRTFLPIKFYLINAVRISSEYPCQAMNVHREITKCVLMISSLGISLSKVNHLRAASEALAEFLEPTSFLLLHTLLNSADVTPESKLQILDWLIAYEIDTDSACPGEDFVTSSRVSLDDIFDVNCDAMLRSEALMLGRVIMFLNLLKASSVLREDMVLEISRKLDLLLNFLLHESIYSSILGLYIPVLSSSGQIPGVVWQPMFSFILHALKTFMIVASSSSLAWIEVETILLHNLLHPHFLCLEIVRELWCFFVRHAETDMVNHILEKLCLLLKIIASAEPTIVPFGALRKMARSICILLIDAAPITVDRVYNSILHDEKAHLSSIMEVALLLEGFPLDSLSENLKIVATKKFTSAFYDYIESNSKELGLCSSLGSCNPGLHGWPVYALSSTLHSRQMKNSDIVNDKNISQFLKFTFSLIHGYKNAIDSMKDHYVKLLSATLDIISNMKHIYDSDELAEVLLKLHTLFVENSADLDALYQCKPSLASFMAGLCHMEVAEDEGTAFYSAIWSLYHVLLRERHWAFIHLALAAFGYFAARTSCTQLWRFVPHDAALSFDTSTGDEVNEDRFMSELKGFLEKEVALREVTPCKEQLSLLVKEGTALKKLFKISNTIPDASGFENEILIAIPDASGSETMEIDENCMKKKKRKLPDGICEGMELLQKGLKVMSHALAQADSSELKLTFSTHISRLENVISHLAGLSDSV